MHRTMPSTLYMSVNQGKQTSCLSLESFKKNSACYWFSSGSGSGATVSDLVRVKPFSSTFVTFNKR